MKEKQEKLIQFLSQQNQPKSARILAEKIGVSIRTIKNYVAEINQLEPTPVIISSQQGYLMDSQKAGKLVQKDSGESLPQNFKERAFYIIKKSLIDNQALNLFDLSDELFVSFATLKADISKMNKTFAKYHVKFLVKHDTLQIVGEEKEKRRLISYIIFEEVPHQFVSQSILEKNFNPQDVKKLARIVQGNLHATKYQLNDFSYINLMIHLLILLESVRHGKSLVSRNWFSSWLREDKAQLVTKIIQEIESDFELELNRHEKEEIHMIFQASANYIPSNNLKELEQIVGSEIMHVVQHVLEDTRQTFAINLMNESFLVPFALHISGLFSRAKQASTLKNPMLPSLKKDFPIVYDIAVFISLKLSEILDIKIPEDETAYISLHIGSELEAQKKNFFKLPTVLLCPKYMNLDERLYEQLTEHFGNELKIESVVSSFAETQELCFDLLITTLPVPASDRYFALHVSPILTEEQRLLLNSEIGQIRLKRKKQILRRNFDDYFDPQFFCCQEKPQEQMTILTEMCQLLIETGMVPEDFYQHVLERENASSTAFEAVAIPHSVYMDAYKTTISVVISKEGILWSKRKVNIILLAAINDVDRQRFTEIYEALLSVFDTKDSYQELRNISDFESFRQFIYGKT